MGFRCTHLRSSIASRSVRILSSIARLRSCSKISGLGALATGGLYSSLQRHTAWQGQPGYAVRYSFAVCRTATRSGPAADPCGRRTCFFAHNHWWPILAQMQDRSRYTWRCVRADAGNDKRNFRLEPQLSRCVEGRGGSSQPLYSMPPPIDYPRNPGRPVPTPHVRCIMGPLSRRSLTMMKHTGDSRGEAPDPGRSGRGGDYRTEHRRNLANALCEQPCP